MTFVQDQTAEPRIERVRHALKIRSLRVESTVQLTPGMLRLTLGGDELADFTSLGFDDHVKILAPTPSGETERRDYTPRRYNPEARTLTIDFALHGSDSAAGPATSWARDARPGDSVQVGGPKGSAVIASDIRRWLLVGDETALPAIGRRIEEAGAGTRITSVVAVTRPREQQVFETSAELTALWAHRPAAAADDPTALLSALRLIELQPETFVWIAAEAAVAHAIRAHFNALNHPPGWMKAGGYWRKGEADAHEKMS